MWELARRSPVGLARSGIHTLWPNFAIGAMFSEVRQEEFSKLVHLGDALPVLRAYDAFVS